MEMFAGKRVLVTGGTGSFGYTILKRLLKTDAAEIIVFSRDEQKHVAMRRVNPDQRIKFVIGDVRNPESVRMAMRDVQIVFHAAAIKHVPVAEFHVMEACRTNIDGAWNVLVEAERVGVERFVSVSTDKAVEPVNVMGMTKAIQERMVSSFESKRGMVHLCVRYGNVLASNGSVVPFFLERLKAGDVRLPVTHKDMTRFLLTLEQAIDLVFFAAKAGSVGEIFVSKMPSMRVMDVAAVMLEHFGLDPRAIDCVGIRPGEKIHETLVSAEEMRRSRFVVGDGSNQSYYVIMPHDRSAEFGSDQAGEPFTSENATFMSPQEIRTFFIEKGVFGVDHA